MAGDDGQQLDQESVPSHPDDLGVSIAGYEDLSEIGRGGFGVVFRARQPEFKRFVAIKVLTGLRDATARRRFDRERQSVGTLSGHPNIVTVHASGFTADGNPYLVMEYLSGGSLAERLEHGPVPWPEVLDTGAKLASAVQDAHNAGILHRDIKPENVLVSDRGEPKLADFGIAVQRPHQGRSPSPRARKDHNRRSNLARLNAKQSGPPTPLLRWRTAPSIVAGTREPRRRGVGAGFSSRS